jgi:hypothetical protein
MLLTEHNDRLTIPRTQSNWFLQPWARGARSDTAMSDKECSFLKKEPKKF